MDITILTLFPEFFRSPLGESMLKRAQERGAARVSIRNIRDYSHDRHHTVDDAPYGGGPGMLMKPEPLCEAIEAARASGGGAGSWVVLLTPQGRPFTQAIAEELSRRPSVTLVCGHYEGMDERVREHMVDEEISLGDFIMTGGEPAALAILDAVVRLLPGVLGDLYSPQGESFAGSLLEFPQYTRPPEYRGWRVPEILLSGDHKAIARWRRRQTIARTQRRRPDLLRQAGIPQEEIEAAMREASGDTP